jgi:hypothetical protein
MARIVDEVSRPSPDPLLGFLALVLYDLDVLSFTWRSDKNPPALFEAWQKGVGPEE